MKGVIRVLESKTEGELELPTGQCRSRLAEEGGTQSADVACEVGMVEHVEGGHSSRQDFCFVSGLFCDVKVVSVEEVERGHSATG